jgi:glucosylglycerate synthase
VLGVPSHRNGRTIGEVVDALVEGTTRYLGDLSVVLVNADGGSSDNTTRFVRNAELPPNMERMVTIYNGSSGKGSGIRAILEVAAALEARACAIFEARAPGITPEWVPALVNPVLSGVDLLAACYRRSAYAGAVCDNFAYPFVRAVFGTDLRDPLANELALSQAMVTDLVMRDVWETDVSRFGINIWMTTEALLGDWHLAQVDLGFRGEGSIDPGSMTDYRILHAVGILFRTLTIHRKQWVVEPPYIAVPFVGERSPDRHIACPTGCQRELMAGMRQGLTEFGHLLDQIVPPDAVKAIHAISRLPDDEVVFPVDLWARLVYCFALAYNKGDGDPDRVADAFLTVLHGRIAAYLRETRGLSAEEREAVANRVVRAFEEARPGFVRQWNGYEPWLDTTELRFA